MKITVITISFNNVSTIADTLRTVREQTHAPLEHIVIDGGSTDGTVDAVRSFPEVRLVSEKDDGLYDAMNKGIRMATGEAIGFVHADDLLYSPGCIASVAAAFDRTGADIVYGDEVFVRRNDISRVIRYWKAGEYRRELFRRGWMPPHISCYVRKSLYERLGLYRTDLHIAADYELLLRFLFVHRARAAYIPEIIGKMRYGGRSTRSLLAILKSNWEVYKSWRLNGLWVSPTIIIEKPLRKVPQLFAARSLPAP